MAANSAAPIVTDGDLLRVRNWLNEAAIKLWLPPLTNEHGAAGQELQEIISKASQSLNLQEAVAAVCIERLRVQALENLSAKKKFEETSLATLRVRTTQVDSEMNKVVIKIALSLNATGQALKEAVAKETSAPPDAIRLICKGQLIKDGLTLASQGVRNNVLLMLLSLDKKDTKTEQGAASDEGRRAQLIEEVKVIRRAAEYLAERAADGKFYETDFNLNITNQSGEEINLPSSEKQALVLAMALHAKGKACLKRGGYDLALPLLLEADEEFRKCRSELLSCVDNHALLQLDIVWCFFKLQEIGELPDAEHRLELCEKKLEQSYGPNRQRVVQLSGASGPEVVLYLRLHLLQGVAAFYRNRLQQARAFFNKAQTEFQSLVVSDENLQSILEYGFTPAEARMGLRACSHQVGPAVDHILRMREKKREMVEREKNQRNTRRARRFGRTANGSWVDMVHYDSLVEMGFSKSLSAEALRQTNNDIKLAIDVLQNNPDTLQASISTESKRRKNNDVPVANVEELVKMGYSASVARRALRAAEGSLNAALDLLATDASIESSSSSSDDSGHTQRRQQEAEMASVLAPDVRGDLYEHLDSDLAEEATLLNRFTALLHS